jgi:CHAT domain-containing protein
VLSACETGIPDLKNADEVIALPAGLLQAGVVASMWAVSELSTMMLMVRFYEFWRKEGLDPAEALRQSQIWMRDTANSEKADYFKGFLPEFQRPGSHRLAVHIADMLYKRYLLARPDENDFEHPFYWAAFEYTGV